MTSRLFEQIFKLNENNQMFHAAVNGQTYGPYTVQQLQQFKNMGQIKDDIMLWTQGMQNWTPANQMPQLANVFNPQQAQQNWMQQQQTQFKAMQDANKQSQQDRDAKLQQCQTQFQQQMQQSQQQLDQINKMPANNQKEMVQQLLQNENDPRGIGNKYTDFSDDDLIDLADDIRTKYQNKKIPYVQSPEWNEIQANLTARREWDKQQSEQNTKQKSQKQQNNNQQDEKPQEQQNQDDSPEQQNIKESKLFEAIYLDCSTGVGG